MFIWAKDLHCCKKTEKSVKKYRRRIENGRFLHGLYCITLPEQEENVFDLIPAKEFKKAFYRKRMITVIGLAKGREEAEELVRSMVEELYQKTGSFDASMFAGREEGFSVKGNR